MDTGSETTDSDSDTGSPPDTGPFAPVDTLLREDCYPCHTHDDAGGWKYTGYLSLVDAPSTQAPGLDRVEPGDRDRSYLWHKLTGTQGSVGGEGMQMPSGGGLSSSERDLLGAWIDAGAPR